MNKIVIPFLVSFACFLSYAQESKVQDSFFLPDAPGEVLAGLGEIPDWIKETVTDTEYRILKEASRYFKIDYTFLCRNGKAGSREKVFSCLEKAVSDIKAGTYEEVSGLGPLYGHVGFAYLWQTVDRTREWKLKSYTRISETMCFAGKYTRVYVSPSHDAGIEVAAWYLYDSEAGKADLVYTAVSATGPEALPDSPGYERYSATGYYDEETGEIVVSTAGTLMYCEDGKGKAANYCGSLAFKP